MYATKNVMSTRVISEEDVVLEQQFNNCKRCVDAIKPDNKLLDNITDYSSNAEMLLHKYNTSKSKRDKMQVKQELHQEKTKFNDLKKMYNKLHSQILAADAAFKALDKMVITDFFAKQIKTTRHKEYTDKKKEIRWDEIHNGFTQLQRLILQFPASRKTSSALLVWRQNPETVEEKRLIVIRTLEKTHIDKETVRQAIDKYVVNVQTIGPLDAINDLLETLGPRNITSKVFEMYIKFHEEVEKTAILGLVADVTGSVYAHEGISALIYKTFIKLFNYVLSTETKYIVSFNNQTAYALNNIDSSMIIDDEFRFMQPAAKWLLSEFVNLGGHAIALAVVGCVFCLYALFFLHYLRNRKTTRELALLEIQEFSAHLQALFSSLL